MRTKELDAALAASENVENREQFLFLEQIAKQHDRGNFHDAVIRILAAEVRRLEADKRRLDWLADRNNGVGQVLLPTACVQAHPTDMRAAIDAAMEGGK